MHDLALSTCYPPKVKGGEAEGVGAVRGLSCHLGRRSAWDGVLPLPRIQLLANAHDSDGSRVPCALILFTHSVANAGINRRQGGERQNRTKGVQLWPSSQASQTQAFIEVTLPPLGEKLSAWFKKTFQR